MINHVNHFLAKVGLIITGSTVILTWLQFFDSLLRVVLSIAGIVAAVYSAAYYRKQLKKL